MKRILVVDDDSSVLQLLARVLPDYDLALARGGDEACTVVGRFGKPDLLITDYLMPTLFGDELIGRLRRLWPELKVLVLTGHGEILDREAPTWWRSEARLAKPFEIEALRNAVAALMADQPACLDAAIA